MAKRGIKILEIEEGSAAEEIGLAPGDRILSVNGHEMPDELALKFYLAEERLKIGILQPGGKEKFVKADLREREDLGIKIEEFRTRTCNNACLFCFIDQLPQGVRPSLAVKDDDYRLSFLHGNYITLTNLAEKDLDRIIEQRLSPLFVSVHATDPELRARILGRKNAGDLDRKLKKLADGGIRIHTQIVLMPGINDGIHLEKTVADLYRLYPGVQSVAVVPLGLSDYGKPKDCLSPVSPAYCREVVQQAIPWQNRFRGQINRTFVCLADEFYLQGEVDLPKSNYYDDFAQIEDGVGMVRNFLDDFELALKRRRKSKLHLSGVLVTGSLFSPVLQNCIERFNQKFESNLAVCRVVNRFLGRKITVAGLLAGQDILTALDGKNAGNFIVIPNEAVSPAGIFIDDLSPNDLAAKLGMPVYLSGRTVRDFFQLLFKIERSLSYAGGRP